MFMSVAHFCWSNTYFTSSKNEVKRLLPAGFEPTTLAYLLAHAYKHHALPVELQEYQSAPSRIRTEVGGFRVPSDDHYTNGA